MSATLLLADDSATIRRVIELTLANEDIRVISVADGAEAIRLIDSDPPNVVLADVSMPKVDGYAVAEHVKRSAELRQIPVILLTGAFEPIDEARARATGCDGVLVKPFEANALLGRVRELIAGQRSAALWPVDLPREAPPATSEPAIAAEPRALRPIGRLADPPPTAAPVHLDDYSALEFARDIAEVRARAEPQHADDALELPDWDLSAPAPLGAPAGAGTSASASARSNEFGNWDLPNLAAPQEDSRAEARRPIVVADAPTLAPPPRPQPVEPPPTSRPETTLRSIIPRPPAARSPAPTPWPPPSPPIAFPRSAVAVTSGPSLPVAASPAAPHVDPPAITAASKVSLSSAFAALLAAERANPASRPGSSAAAVPEAAVEEVVRRVMARVTEEIVRKLVASSAEPLIREELERVRSSEP